jgi:hypothetical protein
MSTRAEHEQGALGNRVTAMAAPLPVYEEDPVLRLTIVREAMRDVKSSKQAVGAEMITQLSGFAPPTILGQVGRLQAQQRFFNVLVTNVPGPQFPLYSRGHALLDLFPMAPLASNQALNFAVMSYNGQFGFGLLADYDAIPDLGVVAEGLEKSIGELLQAAEAAAHEPETVAPSEPEAAPETEPQAEQHEGNGARAHTGARLDPWPMGETPTTRPQSPPTGA